MKTFGAREQPKGSTMHCIDDVYLKIEKFASDVDRYVPTGVYKVQLYQPSVRTKVHFDKMHCDHSALEYLTNPLRQLKSMTKQFLSKSLCGTKKE